MSKIELIQNQSLISLCDNLFTFRPRWEQIVEIFRNTVAYKRQNYNTDNLASYLSEIYLKRSVQKTSDDLNLNVKMNEIEPQMVTDRFRFKRFDRNIHVFRLRNNKEYCEIDCHAVVDGLPCLFEIKLTKKIRRRSRKYNPGSRGIYYAMTQKRIDYVLQPMAEYFGTNKLAYVLIINPELVSYDSEIQQDFRRRNGLIVPFYYKRDNYLRAVRRVRKKYVL